MGNSPRRIEPDFSKWHAGLLLNARIVQMLVGLLRRFSERADVLHEEEPGYSIDQDYEHEQEHD